MAKKVESLRQPIRSKEEGAVLATLFRNIIKDLNLLPRFKGVITQASAKSEKLTEHAITNRVVVDKMTWKVFIYILKDVLNVVSFKLTIELKHIGGRTTVHSLREITLKEIDNENSESDTSV